VIALPPGSSAHARTLPLHLPSPAPGSSAHAHTLPLHFLAPSRPSPNTCRLPYCRSQRCSPSQLSRRPPTPCRQSTLAPSPRLSWHPWPASSTDSSARTSTTQRPDTPRRYASTLPHRPLRLGKLPGRPVVSRPALEQVCVVPPYAAGLADMKAGRATLLGDYPAPGAGASQLCPTPLSARLSLPPNLIHRPPVRLRSARHALGVLQAVWRQCRGGVGQRRAPVGALRALNRRAQPRARRELKELGRASQLSHDSVWRLHVRPQGHVSVCATACSHRRSSACCPPGMGRFRLYPCFLAHPVSLCFSTAPSRFLSSFPRKLRGNQLVWAQNH